MMTAMHSQSSPGSRTAALTDTVLAIVAERGLDHVSVREVAGAAGVSIGTVQHYFPTKDAMLAGAYAEVVRRISARMRSVELGPDARQNLSAVLRELLPLDEQRTREARMQIAFATRAAVAPALAEIQRTALTELREALADAFALAWGHDAPAGRRRLAAQAAIAVADGLALHAISTSGWLSARRLTATLELTLDALVAV
jgi:AcrR family transcriptional regulator